MTKSTHLKLPSEEVEARGRIPVNPFGRLPLEIVERICLYLPGESLKALIQASLSIRLLTQDNFFWKRFMQWDMPWFWELHASQALKKGPEDLNYKRLYLLLDSMTAPRYACIKLRWNWCNVLDGQAELSGQWNLECCRAEYSISITTLNYDI
ncbi:hypothetical protein EYZ11_012295 [Aspergillus tanneri]|uniref:F-box domain-containing protein n=1 Tax=Aspergillus tanneri TaxID=1220188 RepID=A0A4S3J0M3_9EURO|nr:hypothetical protein EYZ11_012295 [Aspergillus tanneri]